LHLRIDLVLQILLLLEELLEELLVGSGILLQLQLPLEATKARGRLGGVRWVLGGEKVVVAWWLQLVMALALALVEQILVDTSGRNGIIVVGTISSSLMVSSLELQELLLLLLEVGKAEGGAGAGGHARHTADGRAQCR